MACGSCAAPLAIAPELPVGTTLADGRYQILSVIGRGGFGITYEAGDVRLRRRVAIKELFPDTAVRHGSQVLTPPEARAAFRGARDRFLREARVLARFTHSGIVRVYEVFEDHGTAYLVMELLGGCPLIEVLKARNRPFTEDEVLDVAGRVAAALRPVHAAGVLHRDLNPSNVMLTEHGRVVLIDFGLARDFDQDQTMGMTRVVTPGYAPLEQYRGEGRFGPSTDVYGLAATCYRLATGRVPVAAIARDAGSELPSVHRQNPAISKRVSDAIGDGLELEPSHRPQDLDAFLARLGIRGLPEGPRSVLLGAPGAEPERLRTASLDRPGFDPDVERRAAAVPPVPDPGPARPPSEPTAPAMPATPAARAAPMPPSPERSPDPDRTVLEPRMGTAAAGAGAAGAGADRTVLGLGDAAPEHDLDRTTPERSPTPAPATAQVGDRTRPQQPDATAALAGAAPGWMAPASGAGPADDGVLHANGARRSVLVPLVLLATAAAAAAPLLVTGAIVLLALPALATSGDLVARRLRRSHGVATGWSESRVPDGIVGPARFARNAVVSVVRCSPVLGIGGVALALWYLLAQTSLGTGVLDALLRIVGAGTVAALLAGSAQGSPRFRTGLGIDRLVDRLAPEGRTTQAVVIGWVVVALLVAGLLWLDPDAFPLP
jgi:serine/threonine-protein kinase